jgi:insulysin
VVYSSRLDLFPPQNVRLFHIFLQLFTDNRTSTFCSPQADLSPRHAILTQLFTTLVEESLSKYTYDASLAGLSFAVGSEASGVTLMFSGYTEKMSLLMEVVLNRMLDFKVEEKLFDLVHDRLTRAYKNVKMNK